jgi:hypothetical protein
MDNKSPTQPANKTRRSGPLFRAHRLQHASSLVGKIAANPTLGSGRNRFTHAKERTTTDIPTPFQHFRARLQVRTIAPSRLALSPLLTPALITAEPTAGTGAGLLLARDHPPHPLALRPGVRPRGSNQEADHPLVAAALPQLVPRAPGAASHARALRQRGPAQVHLQRARS